MKVATIIEDRELLTTEAAACVLGLKPGTLEVWRWRGCGPAYSRVGSRIRYSIDDLRAYLVTRRVDPRASAAHSAT